MIAWQVLCSTMSALSFADGRRRASRRGQEGDEVASGSNDGVARSGVVGSLLRPDHLMQARTAAANGRISADELRVAEDQAIREAIALQESAGIDVISDGEFRRSSWVITVPLFEADREAPLGGFEYLDTDPQWWSLWKEPSGERVDIGGWLGERIRKQPFVTGPLTVRRDLPTEEYAFLKAESNHRTKFTIPAPSWHRIFWRREHSAAAYPTSDDFIAAVAGYLRDDVVPRLVELGCDYIQLDAPNYAQWHVDPVNREAFEAAGHDMDHELEADVEFDNAVFEGVSGVTRALHICRGNGADGRFLASGGYEVISSRVFPRLSNYDELLLEYDSDRAGGFEPLAALLPQHTAVLGLVSTKRRELEDPAAVQGRIEAAAAVVPLDRLALSPQCGFASGAIATTMSLAEQEAKLRLVGEVAHTVWGT
jgi:5-methyltetrahydropteroyltriglutamate--homocysteine methyltransferase